LIHHYKNIKLKVALEYVKAVNMGLLGAYSPVK
jgi:hypothetical protein